MGGDVYERGNIHESRRPVNCLAHHVMFRNNTLVRLRWLVLILPAFALFSTVQVGCGSPERDDFSREDLQTGRHGYGGYGYDDGYGYGYE
jgi:hypothetical protein